MVYLKEVIMRKRNLLLALSITTGLLFAMGLGGCGKDEIPKLDDPVHTHTIVHYLGETPDCTRSGRYAYWICPGCGEKFLDEFGEKPFMDDPILPALGHDWSEWEIRTASCISTGYEKRTCDRCGGSEGIQYPIVAHDYRHGYCTVCSRREYSPDDRENPDLYNGDKAYFALGGEEKGAEMQALYAQIDADARAFHTENADSATLVLGEYTYGTLEIEEAVSVYKAYLDDHPLYYWLGRMLIPQREYMPVPIADSFAGGAVRAELNERIYTLAQEWREDTEGNAYLAALSYHDKILNKIDYAYDENRVPVGETWAHSIVGVFTGRGAVCEGYARSFQLMLNLTGIENYFVTGNSGNQPHAWNLVRLDDGNWYWYDLTYDDSPGWEWGIDYSYFCVNDSMEIDRYEHSIYRGGPFGYTPPENFLENHAPDSGTAISFLGELPPRAEKPYAGCGELLLRETFRVGRFVYAVSGYQTAQLVRCEETGNVTIPECVEYKGMEYTVLSIGPTKDGCFGNILVSETPLEELRVFLHPIDTLTIPKSIRYLWWFGIPEDVSAYIVDPENPTFTALDGVLYTKDLQVLVSYPKNPRTSYVIPDETVAIAQDAFSYSIQCPIEQITFGRNLRNLFLMVDGYGGSLFAFKVQDEMKVFSNRFHNLTEIIFSGSREMWEEIWRAEGWEDALRDYHITFTE